MKLHSPTCTSCLALFSLCSLATTTPGQWQVDPVLTQLKIEGQVHADNDCNNGPPWVPAMYPPLPGAGGCPPYPPLPPVPAHPDAAIDQGEVLMAAFPALFFDFGGGFDIKALDECIPFFLDAESNAASFFFGDGLDTRTLDLFWNGEVNNFCRRETYTARGCTQLEVLVPATFHMPETTRPFFLRIDWRAEGDADTFNECPFIQPECAPLPNPEDFEQALANLELGITGVAGPVVLLNEILDPNAGFPSVYGPSNQHTSLTFPPGPYDLAVDVELFSRVRSALHWPGLLDFDDGEAGFSGLLSLFIVSHDFLTETPFDDYMRVVPAGGSGPRYAFRAGRYEITNQQYADFLNSAEADGGASELSQHMLFGVDGEVSLPDGTQLFLPQGLAPDSRIRYTSGAPVGTRYTVEIARGAERRSYERHPVVNVSWFGALKFCNWLTLTRGLPSGARCYSEGSDASSWHPVTISDGDWALRGLDSLERALLVTRYAGFRLPMDQLDTRTGFVGRPVRAFNEWYKAAAYDPSAPATFRTGTGGELVPPFHWIHGFGRDSIGAGDANYLSNGDPFDEDDGFVGLYDGSTYNTPFAPLVGDGTLFTAAADTNPWGLHDMSGNIAEWSQDRIPGLGNALRGGSWKQPSAECAATWREGAPPQTLDGRIGFRIVQSLSDKFAPSGQAPSFP